jgi:hypothetical protein
MGSNEEIQVLRFVSHSQRALTIAKSHGWIPGARYTNLRDVRTFDEIGFLDIDWRNYNFTLHLEVAAHVLPIMTVARDVENAQELDAILNQAQELARYCKNVVIVPKDPILATVLDSDIPPEYVLGYSVPTRYGGTTIAPSYFRRPVHLLGGRPDRQRRLADLMPIVSLDCNRFTLDASFGDYFDGLTFRPHPVGGYDRCLADSIININRLWYDYSAGYRLEDSNGGQPKV